jgi:DNA-directed RNA polymerase subunit RPC12/RpoP
MKLLVCEECGARHYSASAEVLAAQGARCDHCSGRLAAGEPHEELEEALISAETPPGRLRRPG